MHAKPEKPQEGELYSIVGKIEFVLGSSACSLECRTYCEETAHRVESFKNQTGTSKMIKNRRKGEEIFF